MTPMIETFRKVINKIKNDDIKENRERKAEALSSKIDGYVNEILDIETKIKEIRLDQELREIKIKYRLKVLDERKAELENLLNQAKEKFDYDKLSSEEKTEK